MAVSGTVLCTFRVSVSWRGRRWDGFTAYGKAYWNPGRWTAPGRPRGSGDAARGPFPPGGSRLRPDATGPGTGRERRIARFTAASSPEDPSTDPPGGPAGPGVPGPVSGYRAGGDRASALEYPPIV